MDAQAMFVEPVRAMLTRLGSFLPTLLGALATLFVGWLIARILQELVVKALKAIRLVDELSQRIGLEAILDKGGVTYSLSELLGVFVYWIAMLATLMVAVNVLGMTVAAELLDRVLLYVPNVLAGVIILILGSFFAGMLGSLVQTVSANAGIRRAKVLGQVTRVVLVVFAIEVALEKFIGTTTLQIQLNIVIGAIAFGTALAFGLGCKDLAGRWMSEIVEKFRRG